MDTRKAVALLIYLAITRQGHRRDALANLFWPEYDQSHARATLRRTLSALNKALDGNWLLADRDTIALDPAIPIWIDTETFLQYVTEYRLSIYATEQPDPNGIDALKQAVALYQGDFLTGFHFSGNTNFDSWQFFQADTLRREYSYALEQLVQYYSRRADFDLAIDYAQRWLSLDRFHEPAHYALIQLYAWTGHRATALQQYEECVRILEREFDIQPMPETEQLYIAIKESQDLPLLMPIRSEQRSTEKTLQTEKGDPITLDTTPIIPTTFDTEAATDDSPLFLGDQRYGPNFSLPMAKLDFTVMLFYSKVRPASVKHVWPKRSSPMHRNREHPLFAFVVLKMKATSHTVQLSTDYKQHSQTLKISTSWLRLPYRGCKKLCISSQNL